MPQSRAGEGQSSAARREKKFHQRLAEARSRSDADAALAHMLVDRDIDVEYRVEVAESLSWTSGKSGSEALRNEIYAAIKRCSGAASKRSIRAEYDLIGACAGALYTREGSDATDMYIVLVEYPNASLSEYGMGLLAWAGDDSAWEKVLGILAETLHRPMSRDGLRWSSAFWAIEYLTKYAPPESDRAARLISLVRKSWRRVADPQTLENHWPGIGPDGPPPASVTFQQPSVSEIKRLSAEQARRALAAPSNRPEF